MSINYYVVLVGVILILLDIFFSSDIPTFIAILLFCFVFYRQLNFNIFANIILTILFFFALLVCYLSLWRRISNIFINKLFAKDKYNAGIYGFPGTKGIVVYTEGNKYALINGDLYQFFDDYNLPENAVFTIKEVKEGKIVIAEDIDFSNK